jgi:hypothetical protein
VLCLQTWENSLLWSIVLDTIIVVFDPLFFFEYNRILKGKTYVTYRYIEIVALESCCFNSRIMSLTRAASLFSAVAEFDRNEMVL